MRFGSEILGYGAPGDRHVDGRQEHERVVDLGIFIRRGIREADEEKKRSYIEKYIPHIGIALQEILNISDKERDKVCATLKNTLERSRT